MSQLRYVTYCLILSEGSWTIYYSEVRYLEWDGMNICNIIILVPGTVDNQFAVAGEGFEDETDKNEGTAKTVLLCG